MSDAEIISNLRSLFGENPLRVKNVQICNTSEVAITFILPDNSDMCIRFETAHAACSVIARFKYVITEKHLNLIEKKLELEKPKGNNKKTKTQKGAQTKSVDKKSNNKLPKNINKPKNSAEKKPAVLPSKLEIFFANDAAFVRDTAPYDTVRWSLNESSRRGNAYSKKTGIHVSKVMRNTVYVRAFIHKEVVTQKSFTFPDSIVLKYYIPKISTSFDVDSRMVTISVCGRLFHSFDSAVSFVKEKIKDPFKRKYLNKLMMDQQKWSRALREKRGQDKWHASPQKNTMMDKFDHLAERQKELYGN